jgi:hypothetical protein
VGHVPPDQAAATATATKALSPVPGVTSSCSAVNHLLKSVVREIRTLRSVGTGDGRPPPVTRSRGRNSLAPLTWWSQIAARQMYMWRAVDSEGEVLEILLQPQRDKAAAVRLLRKLLRRQGFVPAVIVTDKLRSYGAALREIGFSGLHEQRAARQQSRGEFASAASTTRTKDARLQIRQISSALCFRPRGRLQHVQHATVFD